MATVIETPEAATGAEETERRRRAEQAGRRAERMCRLALQLKGYRILARRFRCPAGEIDLVAQRGNTVALVEVKARPTGADPAASVSARQWRRIHAAARFFVGRHPALMATTLRFDLMLVTPWHWPRHIENVWHPARRDSLRF